MSRTLKLYKIGHFNVMAKANIFPGGAALWAVISLAGYFLLHFSWATALTLGLACTAIQYLSESWHQLGHAAAAKSTGYPMSGFMYVWVLAVSLYPKDEPELPAEIHIRRAWGGPIASFLVVLVSGFLLRAAGGPSSFIDFLLWFIFLDNLLVFTIGALIPLGFNDGSTILYWWPRRGAK